MPATLYIGIMSGTSLDGADAVLTDFTNDTAQHGKTSPRVLQHLHTPFSVPLRQALLDLQRPGHDELHRMALAANGLADHYAGLVQRLLKAAGIAADEVSAIGAHGQTVRHRPDSGYTLQVNAPARLAEITGIDVVADFRSRDIAAGGQGAPLVPAFHAGVFAAAGVHCVVANIGGMANVTDLPSDGPVRGWDTGPGNVLLDAWNARHRQTPFDAGGAWAAHGQVRADLLAVLLAEPYFAMQPPKSTGRDLFDDNWLDAQLARLEPIPPVDVQATLAELTAHSIASAIARHCATAEEIIVCGGGAFNPDLMRRLARRLEHELGRELPVRSSAASGFPPDQVEALAFAWLARQFKLGLPGNLPAVTGASGSRLLGALYPAG